MVPERRRRADRRRSVRQIMRREDHWRRLGVAAVGAWAALALVAIPALWLQGRSDRRATQLIRAEASGLCQAAAGTVRHVDDAYRTLHYALLEEADLAIRQHRPLAAAALRRYAGQVTDLPGIDCVALTRHPLRYRSPANVKFPNRSRAAKPASARRSATARTPVTRP